MTSRRSTGRVSTGTAMVSTARPLTATARLSPPMSMATVALKRPDSRLQNEVGERGRHGGGRGGGNRRNRSVEGNVDVVDRDAHAGRRRHW